jgi:hypothetical protein
VSEQAEDQHLECCARKGVRVRVSPVTPSIMNSKVKYTKELLEPIVKSSISIQEVMRKLGLKLAGGTNSHLKRKFIKYGLDTSHFLGSAANRGLKHKGGPDKLLPDQILINDRLSGRKESTNKLKRALIETGVPEKCALCPLGPRWNGKKLVLQIDHLDGNNLDNRRENLRFLCPNCHSQTDTFCSKNMKHA